MLSRRQRALGSKTFRLVTELRAQNKTITRLPATGFRTLYHQKLLLSCRRLTPKTNQSSIIMGNALKSGFQRFNAENRAHRLLDKSRTRSAPRHPTTAKAIQELQTKNPEVLHEQQRKDNRLLGLLQNIRVDSTDPVQEKPQDTDQPHPSALRSTSRRSLPLSRGPIKPQTSLFEVPDEIPDGRLTVPMAIEMLAKHKRNPKEWPVERLANDYNLDLKDAKNVLEYFHSFKLIAIEGGPSTPKPSITGGR